MTPAQKQLIKDLFSGMFLMKVININGKEKYKIYKGNMEPVRIINVSIVERYPVKEVLKKRNGIITLHLTKCRQMNGNSYIYKTYKKLKDAAI